MTDSNDKSPTKRQVSYPWRDRLMLATLIAGGALTLSWILVLIGLAWQMVSAVAHTGGHG